MSDATDGRTRKERIREYKERPRVSGVFQVRNTVTGKILLGSSLNLHGPLNSHKFMLEIGKHDNEQLMADWKKYGRDAFAFEVLEVVRQSDDPAFDVKDELTLLEQIWIEKTQPFGERGYNIKQTIRQA